MGIKKLAAIMLAMSVTVAGCGGGSGGNPGGFGGSGTNASSGGSGNNDGSSGNPSQEFSAVTIIAPAAGAILSEQVRLEIEGSGIQNAELLPAGGGRPFALFTLAPDGSRAWVEFDTRTVPNGSMNVVIDAFDRPAGTAGANAIRAMEPRSWTVQNESISSPYPGVYPLRRDEATLQQMIDMSEQEFATMVNSEWPRIHALLQEYIPNNVTFEPPVPRGFEGPRSSCIADAYAAPEACREYMVRIVMLLQQQGGAE